MAKPVLDKPIKIMHVVNHLALAGMEYGVIKLVNRLEPEHFSPMICCLHAQMEVSRPLLEERIPVFELNKRSGRDLRVIVALATLLRRHGVDIVHSHNWSAFFYTVAAATIARVPIVIHGEHGRDEQGVLSQQLVVNQWLAKWASHFVTVSLDLNRELVQHWRVRPERVLTIPNGVNLEAFGHPACLDTLRREFHLTPENRVVLSIGRVRPIKDYATLLRGFARLYPQLPESRLFIVGRNDSGNGERAQLETLAETLGIRSAVYLTGIRSDIPQLLDLCDVYINTSRFEGMSNTILEAMAACKPVVATAVGGNPELVHDGVTGYLISPGNEQQLSERLALLLTEPTLAQRMGAAGHGRIERRHSMFKMVQANRNLYQELFWRRQLHKTRSTHEQIKRWIARCLYWSGLQRVHQMAMSPQVMILTYHRVLPLHEALQYPFQGMVMPKDLFEAQMAYLARQYHVFALPEAIRRIQEGRLPRRAVVITFDDGYRDNYEHAWPILQKYQLPATFFLVTGALDRQAQLWWDEVADNVQHVLHDGSWRHAQHSPLPDWMASLLETLRHGGNAQRITQDMVGHLNRCPREERQQSLQALSVCANGAADCRRDVMLTWEHVHELHRSGMHLGAHTVNHAFVDELDEDEARQEIAGSVARLQQELGTPVRAFAYPRGRASEKVRGLLQQVGVEVAVTTGRGHNGAGVDLFSLKRLDAGYACLSRGFDRAVFEVELHGWFNRLRQR